MPTGRASCIRSPLCHFVVLLKVIVMALIWFILIGIPNTARRLVSISHPETRDEMSNLTGIVACAGISIRWFITMSATTDSVTSTTTYTSTATTPTEIVDIITLQMIYISEVCGRSAIWTWRSQRSQLFLALYISLHCIYDIFECTDVKGWCHGNGIKWLRKCAQNLGSFLGIA